jgi:hypothetical protein
MSILLASTVGDPEQSRSFTGRSYNVKDKAGNEAKVTIWRNVAVEEVNQGPFESKILMDGPKGLLQPSNALSIKL